MMLKLFHEKENKVASYKITLPNFELLKGNDANKKLASH